MYFYFIFWFYSFLCTHNIGENEREKRHSIKTNLVYSRRSLPHIALVEQDMKMEHGFSSIYLIWYVSHKDMMSIYDNPKLGRSMPLSNFIIIRNTFNFFVVFFWTKIRLRKQARLPVIPTFTYFILHFCFNDEERPSKARMN